MMKKQKEEIIQKPVERYFPTTEDGLSASQVEESILDNLTNNILSIGQMLIVKEV